MNVLVVVVNYRTWRLTADCLRSLEPELAGLPGARAVVTDCASGDGSAEALRAAVAENGWGGWASVVPLGRNGGFAYGNNEAVRPALASADPPRYVVLLNPDTVVRPGAIPTLTAFLDAHPEVGLAGPRLEDPDGTRQCSAFRFPSVPGELEMGLRLGVASRLLARWNVCLPPSDVPCPADWVSGACLVVRREVFDAVGLLDDGFFMYYEEVDFCRRARLAGWACWYVPEARVVHLVGQSPGSAGRSGPRRRQPAYWFASRRRYLRRHLGPWRSRLADLAWASGFATYRVRQAVQRKPDHDPDRFLRDFVRETLRPSWRPAGAPRGDDPQARP